MSPLSVRRYRAELLLREEFVQLRERVLASVSARLRSAGVKLGESDLDDAYSQAWQGLYAAVLEGQQIDNPAGWLALVTYRRAIDEYRARGRAQRVALESLGEGMSGPSGGARRASAFADRAGWHERDLAAELDDRTKLRHLFEALRGRLSARERQAATLCYLQGLSRAEAAARMGVSEARMRKLMDGRGRGVLGVAGKLGALVEAIGAGRWCEEQGSLMRGFAYGILDPAGERHRLASIHQSECPACRAYVLSLRGLAAALPPLPSLLHLLLGAGAAGGTAAAASAGAGSGAVSGAGAGPCLGAGASSGPLVGGAAPAASGFRVGAISVSGAAGAAGSSSWVLSGSLGAKLAVGCVLALGLGAGCVALDARSPSAHTPAHRRHLRRDALAGVLPARSSAVSDAQPGSDGTPVTRTGAAPSAETTHARLSAGSRASREFGPERTASASASGSANTQPHVAHAAAAATSPATSRDASTRSAPLTRESSPGRTPAAQREFAPG